MESVSVPLKTGLVLSATREIAEESRAQVAKRLLIASSASTILTIVKIKTATPSAHRLRSPLSSTSSLASLSLSQLETAKWQNTLPKRVSSALDLRNQERASRPASFTTNITKMTRARLKSGQRKIPTVESNTHLSLFSGRYLRHCLSAYCSYAAGESVYSVLIVKKG